MQSPQASLRRNEGTDATMVVPLPEHLPELTRPFGHFQNDGHGGQPSTAAY